jgi:hypothetical protein
VLGLDWKSQNFIYSCGTVPNRAAQTLSYSSYTRVIDSNFTLKVVQTFAVYKTLKCCDNARAGPVTRTKINGDPVWRPCQASPANSRSSNARERLEMKRLGETSGIWAWTGIFSANLSYLFRRREETGGPSGFDT